jgi:hypothetical protein
LEGEVKSLVVEGEAKTKKPYPKLMRGRNTGVIVLFYDEDQGVAVGPGKYHPLGTWQRWHIPHFTDFDGTVTLSND